MTGEAPSLTAQRVAMRRAAHQLFDDPRVFEDPLAIPILGEEPAARLRSGDRETGGSRHIRAFMAARSRYAEDELTAAIARGATQYVVLGAGLDTYAYRNAHSRLRVFEVDHPATQSWKRRQLESAGIAIPSSLTFVPTDFEEQSLGSVLESSGFQPRKISFFSWLGVTPYLTAEAALATLAFIGSLPAGSGVVFDYAVERSSLDSVEQLAMDALASRVARAGEPFRLFLDPRALNRMLRAAGFHEIEDLGPSDIDERYFTGRTDGLRVS
ncbi:MAG TPA: SAM-dependent methyltransferase, partial [Bryobacteraceae bacterium]|nr:SAM-dependent methyltransferase [Bryobacteraceae bacterium]